LSGDLALVMLNPADKRYRVLGFRRDGLVGDHCHVLLSTIWKLASSAASPALKPVALPIEPLALEEERLNS
jgi:hypothetical protein